MDNCNHLVMRYPARFLGGSWTAWLLAPALWLLFSGAVLAQACSNTVSPATLPNGTVGVTYSQTVTASGSAPNTFVVSAGTLPAGLVLAVNGTLSGTPTTVSTSNFTITATDSTGCPGSQSYIVSVAAPIITLAPPTLPGGTAGVPYSQTITASGGSAPYTFAVTTGGLPAGLSLTSAGVLSGTPAAAGTYGFTLSATDAFGSTGSQLYSVSIAAPAIILSPGTLPGGTTGVPYSQVVTASGGTTPYSFALTTGSLPAGLALTGAGVLSGTPTAAGTYGFTITATDAFGSTGSQAYSVVVVTPAIVLAPAALPAGQAGSTYSQTLTASGGIGPYVFAVTVGTLPGGLTLAPNGTLSGTPTAAGASTFTITATDKNGATGNRSYSLSIANGPVPVAVSKQVSTQMDIPVQVDLTAGATGSPFTLASVISVGPGGSATVGPGEVLTFTPAGGFVGSVQVNYTLSNIWGPSAVATITFVVGARPNPVKDPDVVGIETATDSVVRIFAENPSRNVDRRMDTLHDLANGCGFWVSDTTRSGSRSSDAEGSSQSFRINGVTFGGDCPTSHHLTFGVALGYDRNHQDIGVRGSHLDARATSGIVYGSFHPPLPFFLDGSAGHQRINLQTKRALPASQAISQGERSGEQTFSSWTGGYRWKKKVWEIAAYGRMDVAQASLGGYSEDGDPSQALRYGDESIATRTRTFGLRGKFKHKTRWGMVEPRMRVEFLHDFHSQGGAWVQYVDQPDGPQYFLVPQDEGSNRRLLELGVVFNTRWLTLNLQYLGIYGGLYGNDRAWTLTFQNSR